MSEKVPEYRVERILPMLGSDYVWVIVQHHGPNHQRKRIVGYFPLQADAESFAGMANHMGPLAADANGNRIV